MELWNVVFFKTNNTDIIIASFRDKFIKRGAWFCTDFHNQTYLHTEVEESTHSDRPDAIYTQLQLTDNYTDTWMCVSRWRCNPEHLDLLRWQTAVINVSNICPNTQAHAICIIVPHVGFIVSPAILISSTRIESWAVLAEIHYSERLFIFRNECMRTETGVSVGEDPCVWLTCDLWVLISPSFFFIYLHNYLFPGWPETKRGQGKPQRSEM